MEKSDEIKVGDFVIVQRQEYTKLHKVKQHGNMVLGKYTVEMDNIIGHKYFDTFQMKNHPKNRKLFILEQKNEVTTASTGVNIEKSGVDNRNITLDGEIQTLKKEDIDKLTDAELNSNVIVEQLINNSKTFNMKTGYSQEKYIKKKEKKYFEYIQVLKPTIRLLANMFYRQDPTKILNIRIDDLSQILSYANIHSEGCHLLYDSGSSGLMMATITNSLGKNTGGTVIHMHPGNECQKTVFAALQFPQEQKDRCINVNLYSVLRYFYQNKEHAESTNLDEPNLEECLEPPQKKLKTSESDTVTTIGQSQCKRPQWQLDNEQAAKLLEKKCDSLIITAKEHPVGLAKELLEFLKGGRQFVVFSLFREPLQDLYVYLKSRLDIVAIRLCSNFLRHHQVLPERTHPAIMMTNGGYILTGVKLNS
ncbi:tRNA (adenine(58)-N(1))-methyltransferase non-catalytic subunit TRM6 [Cylas formicarius]|uniref:tRNA (adenine(58)-N(1))-methyltransferase non-catalytic subunit TRM6 n=1 Tax=Cylas formicarius TaxID=197179 RepID=UPI0029586482|nr:tRNA (adenine(58)-N(1))-methyltransferase non-catalytic subunit TRM6 [Cylas formicarius]